MKYVLTGSTGHITKPTAEQLVKAGHQVTIITSSADRVKEIEALGAKAAVGSVLDSAFLTSAFTGAENRCGSDRWYGLSGGTVEYYP